MNRQPLYGSGPAGAGRDPDRPILPVPSPLIPPLSSRSSPPLPSSPVAPWRPTFPPYRDGSRWARAARLALALCGVLEVVQMANAIAALPLQEAITGRVAADSAATELAWQRLLDREEVLAGLWLLATLLAAVTFLGWLHRSVANLPVLVGRTSRRSPRAAVGWWFIPLASLWVPYTIVREVRDLLEERSGPLGLRGVLRAWWLLWVAVPWLLNVLLRQSGLGSAYQSSTLAWPYHVYAVVSALYALDAVLAVILVGRLEAASHELARTASPGADGVPVVPVPIAGPVRTWESPRSPVVLSVAGLAAVAALAWTLAPPAPGSGEDAWRTFRPAQGSLEIELPGTPTATTEVDDSGSIWHMFELVRTSHTVVIVVGPLPEGMPEDLTVEQLEDDLWGGLSSGQVDITSWHARLAGRTPLIDWTGRTADAWLVGRYVVSRGWWYHVGDWRWESAMPQEVRRIIDSFRPTPSAIGADGTSVSRDPDLPAVPWGSEPP